MNKLPKTIATNCVSCNAPWQERDIFLYRKCDCGIVATSTNASNRYVDGKPWEFFTIVKHLNDRCAIVWKWTGECYCDILDDGEQYHEFLDDDARIAWLPFDISLEEFKLYLVFS